MKVNILGHDYEIIVLKEKDIPKDLKIKFEDANGICENFSQELILCEFKENPKNYKRLDLLQQKTGIHEMLHGYFYKSGLHQLIGKDSEEAIIDMLAINLDKIYANAQNIKEFLIKESELK